MTSTGRGALAVAASSTTWIKETPLRPFVPSPRRSPAKRRGVEDSRRFRELYVPVFDDLDMVAPWIEKVEWPAV